MFAFLQFKIRRLNYWYAPRSKSKKKRKKKNSFLYFLHKANEISLRSFWYSVVFENFLL